MSRSSDLNQSAFANGVCQAPLPDFTTNGLVATDCNGSATLQITQTPAAGTLVGLGVTTITVTATDEAGNSATCTTSFTVEGAMAVSGPVDASACLGENVNFATVASGVEPFDYLWKLDGNAVGTNGPSLTVPTTGLSLGNHVVEMVVNGP